MPSCPHAYSVQVVGANLNKAAPRSPGAAFGGFSARAVNCTWLSARALPGACWSARDDLCWLQLSKDGKTLWGRI